MSGASERANGRASGPVLQSVFLAVIDHSALQAFTPIKFETDAWVYMTLCRTRIAGPQDATSCNLHIGYAYVPKCADLVENLKRKNPYGLWATIRNEPILAQRMIRLHLNNQHVLCVSEENFIGSKGL